MLSVTLKIKAPCAQKNNILRLGINWIKEIRQLEGCTGLQMFQNIENANGFYIISEWKDIEAVRRQLRGGLFDRIRRKLNGLRIPVEINYHFTARELEDQLAAPLPDKEGQRMFPGSLSRRGNKLSIPKKKYGGSKLSEKQIGEYLQVITDHMEKNNPYLDKNLTLTKLGTDIGIHPHLVSRVINEKLGLNFSNFINRYRVNYSKQFLIGDFLTKYTISSIGHEAGFNSRSAFYTSFRKFIGMTPGDFINAQKEPEGRSCDLSPLSG